MATRPSRSRRRPATGRRITPRRVAWLAGALVALAYVVRALSPADGGPETASAGAVATAFTARQSDVVLETPGQVERILPDDREGTPHQRFIVRVPGDLTVLISHNLDLASRVPVAIGDSVRVRGEYVWNGQGGLIHWTHHDPDGRRPGGWIRLDGRTYR